MQEEALQRAQVLARLGSWEWDLATGRLEFTEEMYRLVGQWPEARPLNYRGYLRFVHPADRHQVNARIRRALRGEPLRLDHRIRLPDGRVRWVHCEGEASFDHAGCPVRILGTALDVTGQRRSIDQLQGGDRLFRVLVENARDVIFRYRVVPDEGFDYLSPAAGHYTGLSREEIYADPWVFFSRVHPDDRIKVARAIADPENNTPYQIRVMGRGGKWLWSEQVLVPIRDGEGKLIAIEGVSRDVTTRKEAEVEREQLLSRIDEERRWLEAVLAQVPGALVLIRRVDGTEALTANASAEALLGAHLEREILDASGTPLPSHEHPAKRALRGEPVLPNEYLVRRAAGEHVPVLASASPIRDPTGAVTGAVVLWEDLTTVKALERMREEWISMVAHDLRQPLTLIRSYAELLARTVTDGRQRGRVSQIAEAARRLGRMIQDLLDASRLESHRLTLEKEPVEVVSLVQGVIHRAVRQSEELRVELRIECDPVIAELDPDRIEQVLMNLLSNAAKYGAAGTPIEVTLSAAQGGVRISIRNRGEPIPERELPRLFGRFERMTRARESKVSGMGLGLYIARGLIEAHGGRIRAKSDPAGFNTFWFELPAGASLPGTVGEHRV